MIISGDFLASGVKVNAKELRLSIEIPKNKTEFTTVVEVIIRNPRVETLTDDKLGFNAAIKIDESSDILKFKSTFKFF
jgi:hypothetical protein